MFFEDHLVESSDSEHGSPRPSAQLPEPHDTATEGTGATPASSQFPFAGRGSSTAGASAAAGAGAGSPAASDLQLLIEAAENERHCPDILPYPAAVIDAVVAHLAHRQALIEELATEERRRAETAVVSLLPFKASDIMAMELQRVQFFLCELLRCRLKKIEALCSAIHYEGMAEQPGASEEAPAAATLPVRTPQRASLSANEKIVADRLAVAKQRAVLQVGLQGAPAPLQHLTPNPPHGEGLEILPEPDLSTYVFGVALEDLGAVKMDEFAEQNVSAGEIFLVPYRTFRPFVVTGQVRLL